MKLYYQNRNIIKTGDVVAFSGSGVISDFLKKKTNSNISHLGIVISTSDRSDIGKSILLMESTIHCKMNGGIGLPVFGGVHAHFLSRKLEDFKGEAWLLPLKYSLSLYHARKLKKWLLLENQYSKHYDKAGAFASGNNVLKYLPQIYSEPDYNSLLSAELVTKALQVIKVVNRKIDARAQTPAEVAMFRCFREAVRVK